MRNRKQARGVSVLAVLLSVVLAACGNGGGTETGDGGGGTEAAADVELGPGVSESEIVVGVHTPLTGPASFVGQGYQLGAELAVKEINDNGGINGRDLSLSFIDDEGTPEGAALAIRRLIDRENVFAILGAGTSTSTVPQLQYFDSNEEVPYYVSLASDPQVLAEPRPNVFLGATVPQADIVASMSDYMINSANLKSVALMQCDQGHCQAGVPLLKEALEEAGVEVTGVETFNSGSTDFTGQINNIMQSEPEAVHIYGLAEDGGRIIRQLRQAGYEGQIIGDTSLSDPSVVEVAGKAGDGLVTFWLASTQYIDEEEGAMGDWRQRFDEMHPDAPDGTPNLYSLMAYGDTYVIAEGLRQTEDEVTREKFLEALTTGFDGFVAGEDENFTYAAPVMMPRTFSEDNHQGNASVTPVIAEEGKFQAVD